MSPTTTPVVPAHAGRTAYGPLTGLHAVLRSCLPGQPERLTALDAAIRAPLPLSTRVGVLAADAGAPSEPVAGLLAAVLAARRPHRVLSVAAGAGLGRAEPAEPRPALDDSAVARRATARTGAEATHGLARLPGGPWGLDLAGQAPRWWDAVAPISRFFDFVVTDWGAPAALDDARAAGGVLLVVASATPESLRAGVELRARLAGPGAAALLAVQDDGGAPRGLAEAARVNGAGWLPPSGRGPRRHRPRYPATVAALELAARVVTAAATRTRTEVPA